MDIPDDSVFDTESSDGRGLDEFVSDQEDEDYISNAKSEDAYSDADAQDSAQDSIFKKPANKVKKDKPKRGDFRQIINNARQVAPASGIQLIRGKRKGPSDVTTLDQPEKRAKKIESKGLLADWKAGRKVKGSNRSELDLTKNELDYAGGEFDEEEAAESVMAARSAKGGNIVKVRYETPISIVETPSIDIENFQRGRGQRKYNVSDLPFPSGPGKAGFHKRWRGQFKNSLCHWAGAILDPFGTNAIMGPKVREIWTAVFPSLLLENNDPAWDAIIGVAGDALTEWRSSAGKDAVKIVVKALKTNKVSPEELQDIAIYYLQGFRYIYSDPDASNPVDKGAFLGPFVLEMFATLLKKTIGSVGRYGHPVGGLALATVTLERAFDLIREGLVTLDDDEEADKKRIPGFTDKLWGKKVRAWVTSTKKLDVKKNWPAILQAAASRVAELNSDDVDADDADSETDPRAMIVIE